MISPYHNKNVLVMGLGLLGGGIGVTRYLVQQGAKVTVTDLRDEVALSKSIACLNDLDINYILGKHEEESFSSADIVVVNPGVSPDSQWVEIARKSGAIITTELGIFLKHYPGKLITITGTKGKSTTTSLIHHLLKHNGYDVRMGGNIGGSLLPELDSMSSSTVVVLEVSSFQIELLDLTSFRQDIAIFTNLYNDHLDRYGNMEKYASVKKRLFDNLGADSVAVCNADNDDTRAIVDMTIAKKLFFSHRHKEASVCVSDGAVYSKQSDQAVYWFKTCELQLKGEHNLENVLAAVSVASIMGLNPSITRDALVSFAGIEHRLEVVRSFNDVTFVNDSSSTIPVSTIFAITSYPQPLNIIMGGINKGSDFSELAKVILLMAKSVHLIGKSKDEVLQALTRYKNNGLSFSTTKIFSHSSLSSAVAGALEESSKGEVVLFSPACASFDMFANSKERGNEFKTLVNSL